MLLVTGAGGFAGSRIVAQLVRAGEHPRAMVRDLARAQTRLPASGVELIRADTTQPDTLAPAVAGVDTIIHTAFITADRKQGPGAGYEQTNVYGTQNLLAAARGAGVQRIIELGGLGTRAAPAGSYMAGRYAADQAIKHSGMGWSILAPSIQFGQGSAFFNGLANLIRQAPFVPMVGDGRRRFQPIWVEDVATCVVQMTREPRRFDGRVVEVGGPEIYTYSQILDMLMRTLGTRKPKVPGPTLLAKLVATFLTAALPKPPITPAAIELFAFDNVTALDAVERNFGFAPHALPAFLAQHGID